MRRGRRALLHAGPDATIAAIPILSELLEDTERFVRETAARALGAMGPEAKAAIPALAQLLQDPEWWVRVDAVEALKKIEGEGETEVRAHVCPWWGGYFLDNPLRRWIHNPTRILAPYVRPGMTALDFGCGMGMFAMGMAKLVGDGGQVIAVDLQQKMLDVLQRRAKKAGLAGRITTHRCEATSVGLHLPIDFALAFYSAHEVPDLRRLLGEVGGRLRPGGKFLVVEPLGHVTGKAFQQMISLAGEVGLGEDERPRIRFSRAVVFRAS